MTPLPSDTAEQPATAHAVPPATARRVAQGGALAGAVAAAPALGSAGLSSLIAACASCLGAGSAVAAGTAAGAGVSLGGVVAGVVALLAVAAVQVRRARRSCPAGPARRRAVRRQVLTLVVAGGLSFAALQWVVTPWLTPSAPATSGPTLP
jgi:hypothetical protein